MIKEFRDFIMRGNVIDMAVGIIIGASFGSIINSLVNDIIMPPIGLLMGKVDFSNRYILLQEGSSTAAPYASLADAQSAGAVTLNYGLFINTIISFLIVGLAVFLLIKAVNRLHTQKPAEPAAPTTRECPFCFTDISINATRCPNCTSEIKKQK
ncbi:MAG: large-conductance mechanosensitive channel protein MscL [Anaerolineae bacterium]|nr:large-conductance mechanosensitive channel protein MscL [Anaerolineae bacterium]